MHDIKHSNSPLGNYLRGSMTSASSVQTGADLWPCPPPYPSQCFDPPGMKPSRRRQSRWKASYAVRMATSLTVVALGHCAAGFSRFFPARGRRGLPLSPCQREMVGHVERLQRSMRRLGDLSSGCGTRLPQAASRLETMKSQLASIDLVPDSRPRVGQAAVHEMDFQHAGRRQSSGSPWTGRSERAPSPGPQL